MNRCCICTKNVIGTTWFCNKCAIENKLVGKKSSDWPKWVKGLMNFEQQDRRKRKEQIESGFIEINYGIIEDLEALADSEVISAN
jgi:hypothetical protein